MKLSYIMILFDGLLTGCPSELKDKSRISDGLLTGSKPGYARYLEQTRRARPQGPDSTPGKPGASLVAPLQLNRVYRSSIKTHLSRLHTSREKARTTKNRGLSTTGGASPEGKSTN